MRTGRKSAKMRRAKRRLCDEHSGSARHGGQRARAWSIATSIRRIRTPSDLYPFLSARWREHMITFGDHCRHGLSGQLPGRACRPPACASMPFPEDGPPGSDLELMRRQHLDANGVEYGMLMQLSRGGMEERNLEFAAALSHAINEWQLRDLGQAGAAAARRPSWCRRRMPPIAVRGDRAARHRSGVRADHHLAARRAIRSATAATGRSTRRRSAARPADRAARPGLQRRPRLDRRRAGRPTTWRSTTPRPRACRTR